ncbi:MAG: riboflavin synthase [Phycisphaerales bacterium]|nr:riboflavin synthase [Phycisphaerales bacterium]
MFTGLVQHLGSILSVEAAPEGRSLLVDASGWGYEGDPGDSISVDGCCLTVVEREGGRYRFDVIHKTLEMTTLGTLAAGQVVNLESAARADSLMGGHLVQGHVDGVGEVRSVQAGDDWRVRLSAPGGVREHLSDRGSITINGVSLTIAAVHEDEFEVALIPVTLEHTNLRMLTTGSRVNLEADCIAKMVARHVERILANR